MRVIIGVLMVVVAALAILLFMDMANNSPEPTLATTNIISYSDLESVEFTHDVKETEGVFVYSFHFFNTGRQDVFIQWNVLDLNLQKASLVEVKAGEKKDVQIISDIAPIRVDLTAKIYLKQDNFPGWQAVAADVIAGPAPLTQP